MKYRSFSDLGWKVSEIGLGCWQIGWCWGDVSDYDARNVLKKSLDKGINFFDTAELYSVPHNSDSYVKTETMIGNWFQKRRNRIIVNRQSDRAWAATSNFVRIGPNRQDPSSSSMMISPPPITP